MLKDFINAGLLLVAGIALLFLVIHFSEQKGGLSARLEQAQNEVEQKDCKYEIRREEEKQREKIYISPNKQRNDVLELMRANMY